MATQKHLNGECEGGSLFEDQCSPHVFQIDLKLSACHVLVLLPPIGKARKWPLPMSGNHSLKSLHKGSNDTEFFHSKV
jgi:hypothetical protein